MCIYDGEQAKGLKAVATGLASTNNSNDNNHNNNMNNNDKNTNNNIAITIIIIIIILLSFNVLFQTRSFINRVAFDVSLLCSKNFSLARFSSFLLLLENTIHFYLL